MKASSYLSIGHINDNNKEEINDDDQVDEDDIEKIKNEKNN